jgi:hypothetical protein
MNGQLGFGQIAPLQFYSGQLGDPICCPTGFREVGGWCYPNLGGTPVQPVSCGSGGGYIPPGQPSNTMNYFQTIASIVSQAIQGFAHNQTNQVGPYGLPYGNPGTQTAQAIYGQQQQSYNNNAGNSNNAGNNGVGQGLGQGLDGIITWATNNPVPVFLLIGGVFLLFRESPSSRRR